jgi:hypothetical protein
MRPRKTSEYVREGLFLALRDVSQKELTELYDLLLRNLGAPKVSVSTVPGGIERREYKTSEVDDPDPTATLDSWVDTWRDASQAGQCAYIAVSSQIHRAVEGWGQARPKSQHVTAYFRHSLPKPLEDSLH